VAILSGLSGLGLTDAGPTKVATFRGYCQPVYTIIPIQVKFLLFSAVKNKEDLSIVFFLLSNLSRVAPDTIPQARIF
jgi:hypothetical protein